MHKNEQRRINAVNKYANILIVIYKDPLPKGQRIESFYTPAISFMTSPAIISPATPGTKATDPGVARREEPSR